MTHQRKKGKAFKSPSTGEYCTAAQYIAEVLIQRKAEIDNKGSLPYKFWNKKENKAYTRQVQKLYTLIKEFGEKRVYDYIINKNKRVYSAFPAWVKEGISRHFIRPHKNKDSNVPSEDLDIRKKPQKAFGKKTLLSRLNALETNNDGEEKQEG